ncbi:MAG TPA: LuxR C-terminal-related transcriptional regulator [Solirubrobacteraceae bacterium]|jgi:DNA-binding NarL/FixJ family response regulator|nr:LuxR C-terminal-related transcriptional regulator [Solirubrobacteraceae bacterium]
MAARQAHMPALLVCHETDELDRGLWSPRREDRFGTVTVTMRRIRDASGSDRVGLVVEVPDVATWTQALQVAELLEAAGRSDGAGDEGLRELTSREIDVLRLLTHALSDAQIAQELVLSRRTVHAHLRSIYRKLDVGSRVGAVRWAAAHGLAS